MIQYNGTYLRWRAFYIYIYIYLCHFWSCSSLSSCTNMLSADICWNWPARCALSAASFASAPPSSTLDLAFKKIRKKKRLQTQQREHGQHCEAFSYSSFHRLSPFLESKNAGAPMVVHQLVDLLSNWNVEVYHLHHFFPVVLNFFHIISDVRT